MGRLRSAPDRPWAGRAGAGGGQRLEHLAGWSGQRPAQAWVWGCPRDPERAPWLGRAAIPCVPRGRGLSFGDASYLEGGHSLSTRPLDRILGVDREAGRIRCEAGVTLSRIHSLCLGPPLQGWQLGCSGGTRWATVGGAAAADIHGKADPFHGSFGNQVEELELQVASGQVLRCSPVRRPELFAATLGGMGLTGLIRSLTLRLVPTQGWRVRWRSWVVGRLGEDLLDWFLQAPGPHQVAWFDLTSPARPGVFHAAASEPGAPPRPRRPWALPLPRLPLIQPATAPLWNRMLLGAQRGLDRPAHLLDFHYPHDRLPQLNRLYGRAGFLEYQFLLPEEAARAGIGEFLDFLAGARIAAWSASVKRFGAAARAGTLSFPGAGLSFTLQVSPSPDPVPALQAWTRRLLALGGRCNLVKDACLTAELFRPMYPRLEAWREVVREWDPQHLFRSGLSERLGMKPW